MANRPDFYSQNFEDVILARCFSGRSQGFYIDVGAQHEEIESVTKHFYEAGWSGINIEPVKEFADSFKCRTRDTTICCAAGAKEGRDSLAISLRTGLSTFDRSNAAKADAMGHIEQTREIAIRRLDDILLDLGYEMLSFEFLKIDVEGFELSVLEGIDLKRYRPEVILCEVTEPNTSSKSSIFESICERIESFEYRRVYFDGLNQWWCTSEKESLYAPCFHLPPNVFDSISITPHSGSSYKKQLSHSIKQTMAVQSLLDETTIQLGHAIASNDKLEKEIALRSAHSTLEESTMRLGGVTTSRGEIQEEVYIRSIQKLLREATAKMGDAMDERDAKEKELSAIKSSWAWKSTQLLLKLARFTNQKRKSS